jgi:glycosyltransferase involved in cell wall biosynthesis
LRIALLSYRTKAHSGGQGVYVRQLSSALADLGHSVTVFSAQPYPVDLDERVELRTVPSLDLYRDSDPFRTPKRSEFRDWIDWIEYLGMISAGFPEPLTFSLRVRRLDLSAFDVVHDNQSLGYGLLSLRRRYPLIATIHHPISRDRAVDLAAASWDKCFTTWRWYGFVAMQRRVAKRLPRVLGVSSAAVSDTVTDFGIDPRRTEVIPLGVDTELFAPVQQRVAGRIVVVASADKPLKGLAHLLDAAAKIRIDHDINVQLVSSIDPEGPTAKRLAAGDLEGCVTVHSGIDDGQLAALIASAQVMVVPSLYEGFSLPAVEAMACGTPLVASQAGALPEVVGDAAVLVKPGDVGELVSAISDLLSSDELRERYSRAGRARALDKYSWAAVARATVAAYERTIALKKGHAEC